MSPLPVSAGCESDSASKQTHATCKSRDHGNSTTAEPQSLEGHFAEKVLDAAKYATSQNRCCLMDAPLNSAHGFGLSGAKAPNCGTLMSRLKPRPTNLSCHYSKCLAACSSTYAFTVSKASAEFVNRRDAKYSSSCRKNASRSASFPHSMPTPCSLSGSAAVCARQPLTLSPFSPGSVAHPNW